jgi:hypothetical protein
MSPRKKKTATDKKKKNLKDPPAEDLFTADWPTLSLQPSKVLEKVSHPATSSDISRLNLLQRKSGGTVNSTSTPVDTTLNNSEMKSSDSLTSSKNRDKKGKVTGYLSALSGSSPDGSTIERTCSEDSKYSYKYPSSGDESFNSFFQHATDKHPAEDNKKSPESLSSTDSKYLSKSVRPSDQESTPKHLAKVSPLQRVTYTDLKMASPDANLEHLIIHIMGFTLTHPVGLALPQSYVTTFDEF